MEIAHMPTGGAPPVDAPVTPTLRTSKLSVRFGGVLALSEVDLEVRPGEILGLIGPNGAGKTTLLNAVTGFQRPTSGAGFLGDVDISSWPPTRIARAGIVRSFQSIRLFAGLSVLENVRVAAIARGQRLAAATELAWQSLVAVGLSERAYWKAATLPHGEQRRLGLARALCVTPRYLLLDEPAAGLDDADRSTLVSVIKASRDRLGCGLVVIEHDVRFISSLCDRVQVLDYGRTISVGSPETVRADPLVKAAYLGTARV